MHFQGAMMPSPKNLVELRTLGSRSGPTLTLCKSPRRPYANSCLKGTALQDFEKVTPESSQMLLGVLVKDGD